MKLKSKNLLPHQISGPKKMDTLKKISYGFTAMTIVSFQLILYTKIIRYI